MKEFGCDIMKNIINKVLWRIKWKIKFYRMNKLENLEELKDYAIKHNDETYIREIVEAKRDENIKSTKENAYVSLIKYFNLDLKDKAILELGPGYGDFLNVCRSEGAAELDFIDYHPYYFTHCRLSGFSGYVNDYFSSKAFKNIPIRIYDIILSKGSINIDRFERQFDYKGDRLINFKDWLDRLESLARPGCDIIICPTYDIGDEADREYAYVEKERKVFDYMLSKGYEIYTNIDNFTHEDFFPFVFYKKI